VGILELRSTKNTKEHEGLDFTFGFAKGELSMKKRDNLTPLEKLFVSLRVLRRHLLS
jgi:hypothetical protein